MPSIEASAPDTVEFTLQNVKLRIPEVLLSPAIRSSLEAGRYESREAQQLGRFLRDGDRMLEFGGGLGFISSFAARRAKLGASLVVEADPRLIPVIEETHRLNGVSVRVINAVALSPKSALWSSVTKETKIPFYVSMGFWGSSLTQRPDTTAEMVPVVTVAELVAEIRPTVIVCDIEGGEIDLMEEVDLASVRSAMFEVHKRRIGLRGIHRLTAAMARQGLYYDPDYSCGGIVTYSRP